MLQWVSDSRVKVNIRNGLKSSAKKLEHYLFFEQIQFLTGTAYDTNTWRITRNPLLLVRVIVLETAIGYCIKNSEGGMKMLRMKVAIILKI